MSKKAMNTFYRAEFFQNSEMLISIYDKDLNLIDANPAFLKVLHFELKDILGKNISEISPDCKPSGRYAIYEEIIRTGKKYVTDSIRLHPSLGSIYIRLTAFKVGDGLGISSKDITDLIETIDDLDTFIYKASHDIRSPITTTLGLLNVAGQELRTNDTAMAYLKMIKDQTEKLDNVLLRLHEITMIRKGEKKFHYIDFNEVIQKTIDSFSYMPRFEKIHFKLNIKVTGKFYTDKLLLNQILQNLIHNAIKYHHSGKNNPFIAISVTNQTNGVQLIVDDNGIGIEEEAQKNVFKMFFRATHEASGSGLGLYTVKQCIKKLKGHIAMQSNFREGTRFTIWIPNEG